MNRWLFLWRQVSRELWVRASAYAVFAVAVALLAAVGAPWVPEAMADRLGGESVEEILTVLASSLLAVATFSVGAMVTAYTAVGSAASPRVSGLVTGDSQTQKALATFVGAFLYAVVAVTAVNARYYGPGGRAILFLFSLAVVGLVAFRLLAWINRLARLARVGHMVELVEAHALEALEARRAAPYLGGRPGELNGGCVIGAARTGYVGNVDSDRLQALAEDHDLTVRILAAPGAFVRRGEPLARVSAASCADDLVDDLRAAFVLGRARSWDQDPRFGLTVLGEIAARALSPAVNDPGTAIQVIGAGVRLMDLWARPDEDDGRTRCDRVLADPLSEADMIDDVFGPVARYGAGDLGVAIRLQKSLASLAEGGGSTGRAAGAAARIALKRSLKALTLPDDAARLRAEARR